MKLKWLLLILLALAAGGVIIYTIWKITQTKESKGEDSYLVRTNFGFVRGRQRVTQHKNKIFYSFQGIPYAKPPIGPLRFKDPLPPDPWSSKELDATKEGSICLQRGLGSEDCLFINVYITKYLSSYNELQPVMVHIHGGGFLTGSGNEKDLGPEFLLEHDVVVVTFNYRLGIFGFLSLENDDIPGNAGLKDQVLALEWVKDNIVHFGGNPNNVTIFGQSAGSSSVHYHILSPMSTGLFHAAILQSGVANNPWSIQLEPVKRAFLMGNLLGSNAKTLENLTEFLRNVTASDLENKQWRLRNASSEGRCIALPIVPSVEKNTAGKNFILEDPKTIMKTGKFNKVPSIIGTVDMEGSVLLTSVRRDPSIVSSYKYFIPEDLGIKNDTPAFQELENRIKKFYFNDKPINAEESLPEYTEICGDMEFLIGIHQTINYTVSHSQFPVYVYQFSLVGKFGYSRQEIIEAWSDTNVTVPPGTFHSDDMGYIFNKHRETTYDTKSKEFEMIKLLSAAWTNFAKYYDPNSKKDNTWQPTEKDNPKYMHFGDKTKLENTYLAPNRTKMWLEIYAKHG